MGMDSSERGRNEEGRKGRRREGMWEKEKGEWGLEKRVEMKECGWKKGRKNREKWRDFFCGVRCGDLLPEYQLQMLV